MDPRIAILTQHADYVAHGERRCTCGDWADTSPRAQYTREPFAYHILAMLALEGYVVTE